MKQRTGFWMLLVVFSGWLGLMASHITDWRAAGIALAVFVWICVACAHVIYGK